MPICYRCGKVLSTNQALDYHLNKKYKCNFAWKCIHCKETFDTQLKLNAHVKLCEQSDTMYNFVCKVNQENQCYLLSPSLKILKSNSDSDINIGKPYLHLINNKMHKYISSQIHNVCERELIKKVDNAVHVISVTKSPFGYILVEKPHNVPQRKKSFGFSTPPSIIQLPQ